MTVPSFELRVVRGDARMQIAPCGELDSVTAPQLEEAVSNAKSRQIERVLEISGLGPLLPLADAPAD